MRKVIKQELKAWIKQCGGLPDDCCAPIDIGELKRLIYSYRQALKIIERRTGGGA